MKEFERDGELFVALADAFGSAVGETSRGIIIDERSGLIEMAKLMDPKLAGMLANPVRYRLAKDHFTLCLSRVCLRSVAVLSPYDVELVLVWDPQRQHATDFIPIPMGYRALAPALQGRRLPRAVSSVA